MSGRSPARSPLAWVVQLSLVLLVLLWTIPTAGLFVTSLRDKDQIPISGWWTALSGSERSDMHRAATGPDLVEDGRHVIRGRVIEGGTVSAFGTSTRDTAAFAPGEVAELGDGVTLTVAEDGAYTLSGPESFEGTRGQRIFYTAVQPPRFTLENYATVIGAAGLGQSFLNSLTVALPATVIPIPIAAYAAYALAWMPFPGRSLLIAGIVGLLVVPLQMSLIPLLTFYNKMGQVFGFDPKGYVGIWLAHTGFGLPLAIYLLRNYMAGLPREIIESARVDGATDFEIFRKIVLPLSFPALASFAIFQFLWVWNDLLVALTFAGGTPDVAPITAYLANIKGTYGAQLDLITAGAFIAIIVPLIVFFSLQRFFVRGLLAGSVKG